MERGQLLPADPHLSPGGPGVRVGACLLRFASHWRAVTRDPWTLNVVSRGYLLPFITQPPTTSIPVPIRLPADPVKADLLREEVAAMLVKRAIEPVHNDGSPGFFSHLFLVPKKNGSWRPVIDLSNLNAFVRCPTFRMESMASVTTALQQGEWTTSIDLKDAYFHVPIHPRSRRFLRFSLGGTTYQFRALPFGLNTAPRVFTRLGSVVAARLRETYGVVIHMYIDDWLIRARSESLANEATSHVLSLCSHLGFQLNLEKSNIVPRQKFRFLGNEYDLQRGWVAPGEHNIVSARAAIQGLLADPRPTAGLFLKVIGHVVSIMRWVRWGQWHVRPLQWCLADQWSQDPDRLQDVVLLNPCAAQACRWWLHHPAVTAGVPLHPLPPDWHVFTDASERGWGAVLGEHSVTVPWTPEQAKWSSNQRELQAILESVTHWRSLLRGSVVLVASDNTTAVAYVNRQGGVRSRRLYRIADALFCVCAAGLITIRARHIQGKVNLVPDMLSRPDRIFPAEWTLCSRALQVVFDRWGTPEVDVFATSINHRLPQYYSPVPDSAALAVDGMSQSWDGLFLYAFPPFGLLPMVVAKARATRPLSMILIAPDWPRSPWYQTVRQLSVESLVLPPLESLLTQPHTGQYRVPGPELHLTAWRLCGERW